MNGSLDVLGGIKFDGLNATAAVLHQNGDDTYDGNYDVYIENLYTETSGVLGLQTTRCRNVDIKIQAKNMKALANNQEGDAIGLCRATLNNGWHRLVRIHDSSAEDILCVDSSGVPVSEDADAFTYDSQSATGLAPETYILEDFRVRNAGKRALKGNATSGAINTVVRRGVVESDTWLGTPDGAADRNNGMSSLFTCNSGAITIEDVEYSGGAITGVLNANNTCTKATLRRINAEVQELSPGVYPERTGGAQTAFMGVVTTGSCLLYTSPSPRDRG